MDARNSHVTDDAQAPDGCFPVWEEDYFSPEGWQDEVRYGQQIIMAGDGTYNTPYYTNATATTQESLSRRNAAIYDAVRQHLVEPHHTSITMLPASPEPAVRSSTPLKSPTAPVDSQRLSNTPYSLSRQTPIDYSQGTRALPLPRFISNKEYPQPSSYIASPPRNAPVPEAQGGPNSKMNVERTANHLGSSTMPLFAPRASHDKQSTVTHPRLSGQRRSHLLQSPRPLNDELVDPSNVATAKRPTSQVVVRKSRPSHPQSRKPVSVMTSRAPPHGMQPGYDERNHLAQTLRPEFLSRPASSLSSPSAGHTPTINAERRMRHPTNMVNSYPAPQDGVMMANARRPENYFGSPSSTPSPSNAGSLQRNSTPRPLPVLGKRPRVSYDQSGDTMLAPPAKLPRSEQLTYPISQMAPQIPGRHVAGRTESPGPYSHQPSSRSRPISYPNHQSAQVLAIAGNIATPYATLAQDPNGQSQTFANPGISIERGHPDTWSQPRVQGSTQLTSIQGVNIPFHARRTPHGYQLSPVSAPSPSVPHQFWDQTAYNPEDPGIKLDFTPLTDTDLGDLMLPCYQMPPLTRADHDDLMARYPTMLRNYRL